MRQPASWLAAFVSLSVVQAFFCSTGEYLSKTACAACEMGNYCPGDDSQHACSPGTYSNSEGLISCLLCPAGYFSSGSGSTACSVCEVSTYSATKGSSACAACPAGTYGAATGLSACTSCPAGTYGPGAGSVSAEVCLGCSPGTYSAAGSGNCTSCPPGTYSTQANATECIGCPEGTYSDQSGMTSCFSCPPGFYTPGTGYPSCLSCPMNSFSTKAQSVNCTACNAGTFSYLASTYCITCEDPENQPYYSPYPYFVLGQKMTCYFQCPSSYTVDNTGSTCTKGKDGVPTGIIVVAVVVPVVVLAIAAAGVYVFLKYWRRKPTLSVPSSRSSTKGVLEGKAGKLEIKIEESTKRKIGHEVRTKMSPSNKV